MRQSHLHLLVSLWLLCEEQTAHYVNRGGLCRLPGGQWCGLDEARAPQNSPWENLGSALIVLCPPELSTGPGIQQVLNKSLRKERKKEGMSHAQNPGLETSDIALGPHSKAARRTSLDPLYKWGN